MKVVKPDKAMLILVVLLCWGVNGVSADKTSAADAKNLAPNYSFESGGPGAADEWNGSFWGSVKKGEIKVCDETAHTGKRSVKMTGLKKDARGALATIHPIDVTPGKDYRFNCWFKTACSESKQAVIILKWYDGDKIVAEDKLVVMCASKGVWSCVEEADLQFRRGTPDSSDNMKYKYIMNPDVLTAPSNARRVRIYLTVQDTDAIYFDDVYFTRSD